MNEEYWRLFYGTGDPAAWLLYRGTPRSGTCTEGAAVSDTPAPAGLDDLPPSYH